MCAFHVLPSCSNLVGMGKALKRHRMAVQRLKKEKHPWLQIFLAALVLATHTPDLDAVEVFSGTGNLTKNLRKVGLHVSTFEILDNPLQDITSEKGVQLLLGKILQCKKGGLVWLGVPCSSWVWVGRGNTDRRGYCPAGNPDSPYDKLHNKIAENSARLAAVAAALGLYFVVEQPSSSLLWLYWPMVKVLYLNEAYRASITLGRFGASTLKPIRLYGTAPWLHALSEKNVALAKASKTREGSNKPRKGTLVKVTVSQFGRKNVSGNVKALKASGAYPEALCSEIAKLQLEVTPVKGEQCSLFTLDEED